MHRRLACVVTLVLLVACGSALAAPPSLWRGKVVGVVDGDTIDVMHEGRAERIRIASIDAPEKGQPFGTAAKRCASDLCFGTDVTVIAQSKDRYGRTVADVILTDGTSLGRELVRLGMAWLYTKYSDDKTLAELQRLASEKRIGLWAEAGPVPPWQWRKSKGKAGGQID